MRRTKAQIRVAQALLADPQGRYYGYSLRKQTGVRSGVLYPILQRMLDAGWLTDGWEDRAQIEDKRPPRRYYELTDAGRAGLRELARGAPVR